MSRAVVVKVSPRRWVALALTARVNSIDVYEVPEEERAFAGVLDAIQAAKRLGKPGTSGTRPPDAGKEERMAQETERQEGAAGGETTSPPPAEGDQKPEGVAKTEKSE